MTTLTTVVEGARVVARTPAIFRTSLMDVTATDADGTVLGSWMLHARHWMEEVGPLIVAARRRNRWMACGCEEGLCCRVHEIHASPHRNCLMR